MMIDKTSPLERSGKDSGGSLLYVWSVALIASIGGLLYGYVLAVISGAVPFLTSYFGLNDYQIGLSVSMIDIGGIAGALFAGSLSDKYGRKKILILTAFLFAASALFTALPDSFGMLVFGRFIGGAAVGASMISALYTAEIAPARMRGILVSLTQFGIVIGIVLTYLSNWLLVDMGPENWRWMFGIGIVPSALFLVGLFFVPESPRWLAKQGKTESALKILTRVGGASHAKAELEEIENAVESESGSLKELFKPGLRKPLIIGVLISIFAQTVGINAVIYYAPVIFMKGGDSASTALFASLIVGVINFIFTIIAVATIDRFGRKPLLLFGLTGMMVSMLFIGMAFHPENPGKTWILIPILSFVAFYAMSLGPIAWVLVSEIFPTRIRGMAMAICMVVLYVADFIVSLTFPWMISNLGNGSFFFFSGMCLAAVLFVAFLVKETKGKSLEQIEKMWGIIKD